MPSWIRPRDYCHPGEVTLCLGRFRGGASEWEVHLEAYTVKSGKLKMNQPECYERLWHVCDGPLEDKDHFPCTEHSEPKTPWPTARKSWYPKIEAIGTVMARWCFVKSPQKSQRHNLLAFRALEIFHVWRCKYTLWWNRGVIIKIQKNLLTIACHSITTNYILILNFLKRSHLSQFFVYLFWIRFQHQSDPNPLLNSGSSL